MSRAVSIGVVAVAMAGATLLAGWWTVPALGALWGARRSPFVAGVGALMGWGGLLAWQATRGPVGPLATQVAEILSLPAPALPALTVLFAGLLGWSAATVSHVLFMPRSARAAG